MCEKCEQQEDQPYEHPLERWGWDERYGYRYPFENETQARLTVRHIIRKIFVMDQAKREALHKELTEGREKTDYSVIPNHEEWMRVAKIFALEEIMAVDREEEEWQKRCREKNAQAEKRRREQ